MREIGIIKLSTSWSPEYSINSVVKNQIRVLLSKGLRIRVLMEEGTLPWFAEDLSEFKENLKYLAVLPTLRFNPELDAADPVFQKKVSLVKDRLIENLQGLDMVFCHDLIYLGAYLYYNLGLRQSVSSLSNITWVHWTHSCPEMDDMPGQKNNSERKFPHCKRYEGLSNSIYISLSETDKKNIAKRYNVSEDKVFVVSNTRLNQDYLNFDPITLKIIEKIRLFDADIVSVLPINLNRYSKQPEISLYIMAALKEMHKKVRLIFANAKGKSWVSKDVSRETHRMLQLMWLSKKLGLNEEEVFFTSDIDPELNNHVPERVIRDLQSVSDIYIHASNGEAFGLAVFEAALFRNLCIVSEEIQVFHELFADNVVWIKGGNLMKEIIREFELATKKGDFNIYPYYFKYYQLKKDYYRECAQRIVQQLKSHMPAVLFSRLKKEFNNDTIFNSQIVPVLEYNQ